MLEIVATVWGSITAFIFALFGIIHFVPRYKADRKLKKILWWCLGVSFVLGLAFQIAASIHTHTYKNDLVLRYDDKFEDKLKHDRVEAAKAINEYLQKHDWDSVTNDEEIDGLENVLSFFEDLGFYWKNGEISGTVLHEHFYYDMRMYCQEALSYIHDEQKKDSKADWENVEPLFNELTRIETAKIGKSETNCVWGSQKLQECLKAEIRLEHTSEATTEQVNNHFETTMNVQSSPSVQAGLSNNFFNVATIASNIQSAVSAPNASIGMLAVFPSPIDTHIEEELAKIKTDLSNKTEVTSHDLLALTKLVSELDKRTEDIRRLPDGRTSLGGIIAVGGSSYAQMSYSNGIAAFNKRDYTSAFQYFTKTIDAFEADPKTWSQGFELTYNRPEWKSQVYLLALSSGLVLQSNSVLPGYAYKALSLTPNHQTEAVLVSTLLHASLVNYLNGDMANSLGRATEAVTNYEFYGQSDANLLSHDEVLSLYSNLWTVAGVTGKTNEALKAQKKIYELAKASP